MEWYVKAFRKGFNFSGRAHRREYWMFFLWNLVFSLAASIVDRALGWEFDTGVKLFDEPLTSGYAWTVYTLAVLIPSTAVAARRLHDTNKSGWWQLLAFIPLVGAIIVIIWLATQGQTGPNRYGPDPRLSAHAD